jgi:hypothetical protein
MITSKPTRYGAGIILYGDYWDLKNLHDLIHRLSAGVPLENSVLSDFILALAYDIRHAYQGDRLEETFGHDELDTVQYRGVKILWPIIIPQIALLRWAAGFHPTSRLDQAELFILEHCIENSLREYDPNIGPLVFELRTMFEGMRSDYYTQFFWEMARQYVLEGKAGKARFKRLPEILRKLSPFSRDYKEFSVFLEKTAKEKNASPHKLEFFDFDDPDFKW